MSILQNAAASRAARFTAIAGVVGASLVGLTGTSAHAATAAYKLSTSTGAQNTATVLSVAGTGFTTAAGTSVVGTVDFQATACATTASGSHTVTTKAVASATKLVLTTPNDLALAASATKTDWYLCVYSTTPALMGTAKYTVYAAPTIGAANSPVSGPAAGGNSVVITGTGFTSKSTVMFGTVAAAKVTVAKDGLSITAVAPAQAAAAVAIAVTTEGGTNATPATATWDDYTYVNGVTVTPAWGTGTVGNIVTVTGKGFTAGYTGAGKGVVLTRAGMTTATDDLFTCTTVQIVSDTELTCTLPAITADTGGYVVVVTSDTASAAAAFETVVSSASVYTVASF